MKYRAIAIMMALAGMVVISGCATLPDGSAWGEKAGWPVKKCRVARAAKDAFLNPQTWIPLAGAALFTIDDWDERVSDWASKHTPIYGSTENARDWSDGLRDALRYEAGLTFLLTPSGPECCQWLAAKGRGALVEGVGAWGLGTMLTTGILKKTIKRERPDGPDDDSFPSGHTSGSFSLATLSNRNFDSIEMPEGLRPGLKVTNVVVASGVGWARVEGKRHFPSDVLFGAALGHFMTAFIHDAFMNLPRNGSINFLVYPTDGGFGAKVSLRF